MIINVLSLLPVVDLQLVFTPEELEHPLFYSTMSKMYDSEEYIAHKKNENVNITLNTTNNTFEILGKSVDEIRELWCGDVEYTYEEGLTDDEGNPIPDPKDLSHCPCFVLGETDEEAPEPDII
jgi:hypothetical protein